MKFLFGYEQKINCLTAIAVVCFILRALEGVDLYLWLAMLLGCLIFFIQALNRESVSVFYLASLVVVVFSYLMTFNVTGFGIGKLFIPLFISCTGIAWRIATHGFSYQLAWALFYGSLAYFLVERFVFGTSEDLIFAYSRNHISVYFINLASLLYIAALKAGKRISIFPAMWAFCASLAAVGIGGIVASGVLFGFIVYQALFSNLIFNKSMLLVTFALLVYTLLNHWADIAEYLLIALGLQGDIAIKIQPERLFEENARYKIWAEYTRSLDWERILFGVSLDETFFGYSNLHSSYLLLHARMGAFALGLILIFLISLARLFKANFVLFVCLFSILLRAFTDTTMLAGSSFDFVLIYLVFFSTGEKQKVAERSEQLSNRNYSLIT